MLLCCPIGAFILWLFAQTRKPNESIPKWMKSKGWNRWKTIRAAQKEYLTDIEIGELLGKR
jgi:hypothetical protein